MAYNRSSFDSESAWTLVGVALLLVGLLVGAVLWNAGDRMLGVTLLLAGVLGGPILIGLYSA
jgi:hypothetical protein